MFGKRIAVDFSHEIAAWRIEISVPPHRESCGRKVADAGLRQTDREESRLPPPVLKAHVDESYGALASFRSHPPPRALLSPDGSPEFRGYAETANALENFHQSLCDKMTNSTEINSTYLSERRIQLIMLFGWNGKILCYESQLAIRDSLYVRLGGKIHVLPTKDSISKDNLSRLISWFKSRDIM